MHSILSAKFHEAIREYLRIKLLTERPTWVSTESCSNIVHRNSLQNNKKYGFQPLFRAE